MNDEIILTLTKSLILRLWATVPESGTFGAVETIQQCAQQRDLFMLSRKKKSVTFSVRSFLVVARNESPGKTLDFQDIE